MNEGELEGYLRKHWYSIKKALLDGQYIPYPGRKGICALGK